MIMLLLTVSVRWQLH